MNTLKSLVDSVISDLTENKSIESILLKTQTICHYLIIALKQYRLYHSNDTASLAWLQVSLFTWLAIPV